ncbi:MAG: cytochrome c biogenesis protein CcdA [Polyangiales bacterium]
MEPSLPAVFGAGVLSFASPCVLPMVPIYLATLAGASVSSLAAEPPRRRLVLRAASFALGLAVPFVLLGMAASAAGRVLSAHRGALSLVGAAVIVLLGLKQLRLLRLAALDRDLRPGLARVRADGFVGAFLFGAAFGVGWTPCVGPVLGAVLTWTAQAGSSPARGALTLGVYALGIGLPLVIAGAFAPTALRALRRWGRGAVWFERASGLALVGTGLWIGAQNLPARAPTTTAPAPVVAHAAPCDDTAVGCGLPAVSARAEAPAAPRRGVVAFVRHDCPACAAMAPEVRHAERACRVAVRRVLVDDPAGMAEARAAGVLGVPTFIGYDQGGREVTRFVGAQPRALLMQVIEDLEGHRCGG